LVNKGYDLWVGNNRGNKYSKGHINKEIKDYDYWNFSFDQMGLFDLPAFYKTILEEYSEKQKIIYIAHSQGTSQMFAACSSTDTQDTKNKEFIISHTAKIFAIEPITYLSKVSTKVASFFSKFEQTIQELAEFFQIYEIAASPCSGGNQDIVRVEKWICSHFKEMCDEAYSFFGFNEETDNIDGTMEVSEEHQPAGASLRSIVHYGQMIQSSFTFKKFDYFDVKENQKHYRKDTAPDYD